MMNQQAYYRISVKGIVIDEDGRILLAKEDTGAWDILGGGLDHGEDPIDCLQREIHEEAGLEVTYISPSPIYFVTAHRPASGTFFANVIYEVKLKNLAFVPSEECQELRFFNMAEMHQVDLQPNVIKLLEVLEQRPAA